MTHVVTITELKKLIPEVRSLEGMDFDNNLKKFLSVIIENVEKTGEWEFVQYVQHQTPYFVVRENVQQTPTKVPKTQSKTTRSRVETAPEEVSKTKNLEPVQEEEKVQQLDRSEWSDTSKLFSKTKMPW